MKKIVLHLFFVFFVVGLLAQQQFEKLPVGKFLNPVFAGDYPDPSILRDGEEYYMVHSSFEYYPGLQIWHSADLVNWKPLTTALHKYVGSVWAPELVRHKNRFYIYFPVENTNYVVWAPSINGPWSDPVDLKIGFIDPGHVTDEQGNRYLYFSSGAYVPLSDDGLSVIGEPKHVYDGWTIPRDWSIECFCMEGPKLIKHGDYYYLTVAQGGTAGPATGHMIISARSRSPFGPWENSPYNPIVRAKDNRAQWCSVGHGTVLDDAQGKSWLVFHGYENGYYNMGRQTLMLPIEWTRDGWYRIPEKVNLSRPISKEGLQSIQMSYPLDDDFKSGEPGPQWKFFGEYNPARITHTGNWLELKAQGNSIANCSPLLCIPYAHSYIADVEMEVSGNAIGGLVLFYNKQASSGILADTTNILTNLRGWQFVTASKVVNRKVFLRLIKYENTVDMYFSTNGDEWMKTENSMEVSGLHHNVLSGFMSLRLGLCAIGQGGVRFRNFKYRPVHEK